MRKLIVAAFAALALLTAPTVAQARPYLHLAEAQSALRGGYGSDNDIAAIKSAYGYDSFYGWGGYVRYNSYDICVYGTYVFGGLFYSEPFESYYTSSATSVYDIYDAHRNYTCPGTGVTQ